MPTGSAPRQQARAGILHRCRAADADVAETEFAAPLAEQRLERLPVDQRFPFPPMTMSAPCLDRPPPGGALVAPDQPQPAGSGAAATPAGPAPSGEASTGALTLTLAEEAQTLSLAAALADCLVPDLTVYLHGDLGAGKTTLVRGILRALGFTGRVRSPSFTLLELYVISRFQIYHFDFYRFDSPDEFLEAGFDEYFRGQGIRLIEWPARAAPHLPPADLEIELVLAGDGRQACLAAHGERGETCLHCLRTSSTVAVAGATCCVMPSAAG